MNANSEIQTKVMAAVYIGNGTKMHIVEATVKGTEFRYGRENTLYTATGVYCGSVRWTGLGRSMSHSLDEIGDRWTVAADATPAEKFEASRPYRAKAAEALVELAGANACEKCLRDFKKIAEFYASKEVAA